MIDGTGQRLQGRPLSHADLASLDSLVPDWLEIDQGVRASLPAIWTRLLGQPGFNGDVIEDLRRPVGQRVVGFGTSIALDRHWLLKLQDAPPERVSAKVYESLRNGTFAPPDDKALGRMNAQGEVAFLVLHYHQLLSDLENPDTVEVLGVAMDLFRASHSGFRLSALYQEGIGDQGAYLESMGFRRLTNRGNGAPELFGLTRQHAQRMLPGSPVRDAFQFTPPQFSFSGSERRLLRLATSQMSDEQIGLEVGLSGHSIKKLWRGIYQRSVAVMPDLFEEGAGLELGTRGPEKRRPLLQYLRQHPEELRPFQPTIGVGRGSTGRHQPQKEDCGGA